MHRPLPVLLVLGFCMSGSACEQRTCISLSDGSWHGPLASEGSVAWSCGLPTADDRFVVRHDVRVPSNLGAPQAPLTGAIDVEPGGSLTLDPGVTLRAAAPITYRAGSRGTLRGSATEVSAPEDISFPGPTTISFRFGAAADADGRAETAGLPEGWNLCDSASHCPERTVHAATASQAATLLYVDWVRADEPADRLVRHDGLPPESPPVHDPGLFLEVSEVDPEDGVVTVLLPDVGAVGALRWFNVEEALDGTRLRNRIGDGSFTVHSAGLRTNNENKRRFEIRIDPDDRPFDADHEFEGFLACRSDGSWCARIVKSLADHHEGTGETLVVWSDPTGLLLPGDELDVYYARPTPGDPIVLLNPVKLDLSGGGRLVVAGEADVATRANPAFGWWVKGATGNANDSLEAGVSFENESLGIVLDLALVELGEGRPMPEAISSADSVGFLSRTPGIGITDLMVSRLTVRFPQVDQTEWSEESGFLSTPNAIVPQERGGDGQVQPWRNNGLRRIRIEGFNYGLNGARGGKLTDCRDGIWLQDVLMLHGRSAIPRVTKSKGNDGLETLALGVRCDIDRVAVAASAWSSALVVRSAREGPNFWTSVVVFGADGRVSDAFPAVPDATTPPMAAIFGQPAYEPNFGPFSSDGHAKFVNWMTDGKIQSVDNYYGARMDYYVAESATPPGPASCGESVGYFAVGGGPASAPESALGGASPGSGACTAASQPRFVDLTLVALQDESNLNRHRGYPSLVQGGPVTQPPASFSIDSAFLWYDDPDGALTLFDAFLFPTGWLLPELVLRNVTLATASQGISLLFRDPPGGGIARVISENFVTLGPAPEGVQAQVDGVRTTLGDCALCEPGGAQPAGPSEALPHWSGPFLYDWPFAWATVHPMPGYRRKAPRGEFLPDVLRARMGEDTDGDGVVDPLDNCIRVADASQRDADGDGYGNVCDADLDGDGRVSYPDLARLRASFFQSDPVADLDGDGVVGFSDLAILQRAFFGAPGPSGRVR